MPKKSERTGWRHVKPAPALPLSFHQFEKEKEKEMDEMVDRIVAEDLELEELTKKLPADIRRMYEVAQFRSHASVICVQLLKAIHKKSGPVDVFELRHLDQANRRVALRLIGLCSRPSRLSDAGLYEFFSDAEIQALFGGS
jgi:hypothetical protein